MNTEYINSVAKNIAVTEKDRKTKTIILNRRNTENITQACYK